MPGREVSCVLCGHGVRVSLAEFDARSEVKCDKCGNTFGVGDLLQNAYEKEPYVKKCVDTIVRYATRKWGLTGKNAEVAERALRKGKPDELPVSTATSLLVQGCAFLLMTDPWQLLPAHRVKVSGNKFTFDSDAFPSDEIVHLKRHELGFERAPNGESMIRIVLPYLYQLGVFRKAPAQMQTDGAYYRDYLQEEIQLGLGGIPDFVLERRPPEATRQPNLGLVNLIGQVRDLQGILVEGFRDALGKYARREKLSGAPELKLTEVTTRRVLIDCGADFSREKATIKQLRDRGIINHAEYERMLSKFDDP